MRGYAGRRSPRGPGAIQTALIRPPLPTLWSRGPCGRLTEYVSGSGKPTLRGVNEDVLTALNGARGWRLGGVSAEGGSRRFPFRSRWPTAWMHLCWPGSGFAHDGRRIEAEPTNMGRHGCVLAAGGQKIKCPGLERSYPARQFRRFRLAARVPGYPMSADTGDEAPPKPRRRGEFVEDGRKGAIFAALFALPRHPFALTGWAGSYDERGASTRRAAPIGFQLVGSLLLGQILLLRVGPSSQSLTAGKPNPASIPGRD